MTGWPCYFAGRDFSLRSLVLPKGQPFPEQDKFMIRGWCKAAGTEDAWDRPFGKLPVRVLDVGTADRMAQIVREGISYDAAKKMTEGAAHVAER